MKTTLIYTAIAGYGFGSLSRGMEAGWVSHGLAHLSSAAKAQGFALDLIDLRALSGWDHLRQELLVRRPDVVGLTMMSVDYNPGMEAVRIVKEALPETVIVVGGPHPTIMVEEVAEIPGVDYVVTREGEVTFPWLLGEIQAGIELTREQDPLKAAEIEAWLARLTDSLQVLPMDGAAFRAWARLMHRKSDTLYEDAMIAATAQLHRLTVVTRNVADFGALGVPVLNPFEALPR